MLNEYIDKPLEIGTVLKEDFDGEINYYIVGEYFVFSNDYDYPDIRPYKFNFNKYISIASEDEKHEFIEALRKNHLIWDEEKGTLHREFNDFTINLKIQAERGKSKDEIITELKNLNIISHCPYIHSIEFN